MNTDQCSLVESENISEEKWVLKIKNNKLRDLRVIYKEFKTALQNMKISQKVSK